MLGKKKNKYNARKVKIDGITFDSIKESEYYLQFRQAKEDGHIIDFEVHPKIELLAPYTDSMGQKVRGVYYYPDFITYYEGITEFVDVKGGKATQTQLWKLKWKMLRNIYKEKRYRFIVV